MKIDVKDLTNIGFKKIGVYFFDGSKPSVQKMLTELEVSKFQLNVYVLVEDSKVMYIGQSKSFHRALDYYKKQNRMPKQRQGVIDACIQNSRIDIYARVGKQFFIENELANDTVSLEQALIVKYSPSWNTRGKNIEL